jgi:glycerol-3-phosphate acyltransferase PlsX
MKRVALCPNIPTLKEGGAIMLDVGANIEIRPEHIVQYAEFAHIYSQAVRGIENPTCALLNIGTEPGKGRELEKETYQLLSENKLLNFKGNIEPKELLTSDIDIIITDGFTGNIAMKTFEGAAKAFGLALKDEIQKTFAGKLGYLFMRKNLSNFKQRFSADEIGGAAIFGVDGVVIKAHGSSSAYAFKNAIRQARLAVLGDVVNKMKERIQDSPISE